MPITIRRLPGVARWYEYWRASGTSLRGGFAWASKMGNHESFQGSRRVTSSHSFFPVPPVKVSRDGFHFIDWPW